MLHGLLKRGVILWSNDMNNIDTIAKTKTELPFLLYGLDENIGQSLPEASDEWFYSPKSQVTNMLEIIEKEQLDKIDISCTGVFGDSTPTTTSSVAGTTGIINTDSDSSNDDEGTD